MKTLLRMSLLILLTASLSGCPGRIEPLRVEEPSSLQAGVYRCSGDFEFVVDYQGEDAVVHLSGREILLPRVPAASGSKFSNGQVTFWKSGERAILETPARTYTDCTIP